jgi:hypothetical protein
MVDAGLARPPVTAFASAAARIQRALLLLLLMMMLRILCTVLVASWRR